MCPVQKIMTDLMVPEGIGDKRVFFYIKVAQLKLHKYIK